MTARLVGLSLIALGLVFGAIFIYSPLRDAGSGLVSIKALVFVPLTIAIGLSFLVGGAPVFAAFQARPKTKTQTNLVLSIMIAAAVVSGFAFWQIKSRWMQEQKPVLLEVPKMPPSVTQPQLTPPPISPPR